MLSGSASSSQQSESKSHSSALSKKIYQELFYQEQSANQGSQSSNSHNSHSISLKSESNSENQSNSYSSESSAKKQIPQTKRKFIKKNKTSMKSEIKRVKIEQNGLRRKRTTSQMLLAYKNQALKVFLKEKPYLKKQLRAVPLNGPQKTFKEQWEHDMKIHRKLKSVIQNQFKQQQKLIDKICSFGIKEEEKVNMHLKIPKDDSLMDLGCKIKKEGTLEKIKTRITQSDYDIREVQECCKVAEKRIQVLKKVFDPRWETFKKISKSRKSRMFNKPLDESQSNQSFKQEQKEDAYYSDEQQQVEKRVFDNTLKNKTNKEKQFKKDMKVNSLPDMQLLQNRIKKRQQQPKGAQTINLKRGRLNIQSKEVVESIVVYTSPLNQLKGTKISQQQGMKHTLKLIREQSDDQYEEYKQFKQFYRMKKERKSTNQRAKNKQKNRQLEQDEKQSSVQFKSRKNRPKGSNYPFLIRGTNETTRILPKQDVQSTQNKNPKHFEQKSDI